MMVVMTTRSQTRLTNVQTQDVEMKQLTTLIGSAEGQAIAWRCW